MKATNGVDMREARSTAPVQMVGSCAAKTASTKNEAVASDSYIEQKVVKLLQHFLCSN